MVSPQTFQKTSQPYLRTEDKSSLKLNITDTSEDIETQYEKSRKWQDPTGDTPTLKSPLGFKTRVASDFSPSLSVPLKYAKKKQDISIEDSFQPSHTRHL